MTSNRLSADEALALLHRLARPGATFDNRYYAADGLRDEVAAELTRLRRVEEAAREVVASHRASTQSEYPERHREHRQRRTVASESRDG
jgi:hypothetical protein